MFKRILYRLAVLFLAGSMLCLTTSCAGTKAGAAAGTEEPVETAEAGETAEAAEAGETAETAEETMLEHHDRAEDLLILVDFQNVYLPGQPWACPTIEQSAENTLNIIRSPYAPDYVLTQYMAPENPVGCWVRYNEAYAEINADAFLCDFTDSIKEIATDDNVIVKSTYSSMDSEQLQALLAGKKRVVLTGVVAECCVLATMMDAIDLGYEVVYLYDCISGASPEYEKAVRDVAELYVPIHTQVMDSAAYLRTISPEE